MPHPISEKRIVWHYKLRFMIGSFITISLLPTTAVCFFMLVKLPSYIFSEHKFPALIQISPSSLFHGIESVILLFFPIILVILASYALISCWFVLVNYLKTGLSEPIASRWRAGLILTMCLAVIIMFMGNRASFVFALPGLSAFILMVLRFLAANSALPQEIHAYQVEKCPPPDPRDQQMTWSQGIRLMIASVIAVGLIPATILSVFKLWMLLLIVFSIFDTNIQLETLLTSVMAFRFSIIGYWIIVILSWYALLSCWIVVTKYIDGQLAKPIIDHWIPGLLLAIVLSIGWSVFKNMTFNASIIEYWIFIIPGLCALILLSLIGLARYHHAQPPF